MRSSSGAFNYSLRTIPPLVSFGDYISEYLFAASRSSPRPTPLSLLRPSLAIYPLWLTPFTPLRAASLQACLLPTAAVSSSSSSSSSSSIVGCYLVATDDGCCPLVLQSRNTPWPACHLSNRSRSHSAAPSGKSAAVCSVASQAETGLLAPIDSYRTPPSHLSTVVSLILTRGYTTVSIFMKFGINTVLEEIFFFFFIGIVVGVKTIPKYLRIQNIFCQISRKLPKIQFLCKLVKLVSITDFDKIFHKYSF